MLVADGIVRHYGGVRALAGAGLTLRPGQVHALLGENGAGKSTLVRIVTGLERPEAGSLIQDGDPVHWRSPLDARAAGVATVSQELNLFGDLDVLSNLFSHGPLIRRGLTDRAAMRARAEPVLAALGLDCDPRQRLAGLSLAEQQLVEVARALIADPSVLVLDEPTSALGPAATERLLGIVRQIADRGVAVLYVSHFLPEVTAIADRVTVLRDGANALTDRPVSALGIEDLVRAMLGDRHRPDPAPASPEAGSNQALIVQKRSSGSVSGSGSTSPEEIEDADEPTGTAALGLRGVRLPGVLEDLDLELGRGEIVGLTGLQGAGHEVVLRLLWGLQPTATGQVRLPRGNGVPRSAGEALRAGVAFIPSDRKRLGLMLDKPVWENITAVTALATGRRWLRRDELRAQAQEWVDRLRIRCELDSPVAELSGGNQQKVVFAKWLAVDPGLLLLDDPTRGVDVGAKQEMHELIRACAGPGRAVLLCSTDLAELAELCDRVVLLRRGRPAPPLAGPTTESALLSALNSPSW